MFHNTLLAIRASLRSTCVANGKAGGYIAIAIAVLVALSTAHGSRDGLSDATTDPGPEADRSSADIDLGISGVER